VNDRKLDGCLILVAEDDLLILLDLEKTFEDAGAEVVSAIGYDRALALADTPGLNVAVIDISLAASNGWILCLQLTKLGVPFIFYSGRDRNAVSAWPEVPFICKPALPESLMDLVSSVFRRAAYFEG
jgi:DNA-binding response OmpR family regulator